MNMLKHSLFPGTIDAFIDSKLKIPAGIVSSALRKYHSLMFASLKYRFCQPRKNFVLLFKNVPGLAAEAIGIVFFSFVAGFLQVLVLLIEDSLEPILNFYLWNLQSLRIDVGSDFDTTELFNQLGLFVVFDLADGYVWVLNLGFTFTFKFCFVLTTRRLTVLAEFLWLNTRSATAFDVEPIAEGKNCIRAEWLTSPRCVEALLLLQMSEKAYSGSGRLSILYIFFTPNTDII